MATKYKNPLEAETALTSAFAPTSPEQIAAIQAAAALVPGGGAEMTPSSIYSGIGGGPYGTSALNDAGLAAAQFATTGLSSKEQNQIRQSTLSSFQAEIDAQNELYANKLREAQAIGANRIGSGTAIQARRGLLGSDFGTAQANTIVDANQGVYNSINAEKAAAVSTIMGAARKAATEAIKEKTAAKQAGLDSYLKYLQEGAARQEANASKAAKLLLSQGHAITDLNPTDLQSLLNGYGITKNALSLAYKEASDAAAAEALKNQFVLSKGQRRYDASGNLIAEGSPDLPPSAEEYEYAVAQGYKGSFGQYQNEDANRKARAAGAAGANGFTPYQTFQATQNLKKNVQTMTAASQELQRQIGIMNSTWSRLESGQAKDLNGTTQAIVTTFNKMLDPTSVVREAEYDRSASGQALVSQIQGRIAALTQGGNALTKESLKELVDLGNTYAKRAQASIEAKNAQAREEAEFFGLNPEFVVAPSGGGRDFGVGDDSINGGAPSQFEDIQQYITIDKVNKKSYIPRSVWSTLGARQDALLAEAAADGYTLLVKE